MDVVVLLFLRGPEESPWESPHKSGSIIGTTTHELLTARITAEIKAWGCVVTQTPRRMITRKGSGRWESESENLVYRWSYRSDKASLIPLAAGEPQLTTAERLKWGHLPGSQFRWLVISLCWGYQPNSLYRPKHMGRKQKAGRKNFPFFFLNILLKLLLMFQLKQIMWFFPQISFFNF